MAGWFRQADVLKRQEQMETLKKKRLKVHLVPAT